MPRNLPGRTAAQGPYERLIYYGRLMLAANRRRSAYLPTVPRPTVANINLTENCQSRCQMCSFWQVNTAQGISKERAIRLMREVYRLGIPSLRFLGGEPLLRRDFFSILEETRDATFKRITLATNGLLLTRFAEAINTSPITHVTVSLDGLAATHDFIRGVPGGFAKILDGLRMIRGKRIKIGTLITGMLAEDLEPLIDLCEREGWDFDLHLPSYDLPYARAATCVDGLRWLWPNSAEIDRITNVLAKRRTLPDGMLAAARRYLTERRYPQKVCVLGFTNVIIRADGSVHSGCYDAPAIGNINERSLEEILRSPMYRERAQQMFELKCSRCVYSWQISYVMEKPLRNWKYGVKRLASSPNSGSGGASV